jgi:hypothetical protein
MIFFFSNNKYNNTLLIIKVDMVTIKNHKIKFIFFLTRCK